MTRKQNQPTIAELIPVLDYCGAAAVNYRNEADLLETLVIKVDDETLSLEFFYVQDGEAVCSFVLECDTRAEAEDYLATVIQAFYAGENLEHAAAGLGG
jgi:hypothetical protein